MLASPIRFGDYELDAAGGRLKRRNETVHLERRPMDLLALLVEKPGKLVSREEIVNRLWGPDLFVDSESGINTAVRKLRQALQDSPDRPAYVETVPGKGYRFIGSVHSPRLAVLAVLPVVSFDLDPDRQYLADGLTEELIAAIGQVDPTRLRVIGRTSMMTYKNTTRSLSQIGQELGAEFLVETSLRADAGLLRITSRLTRATDQVQLWCESFDNAWETSVLAFQQQLSLAIARQVSSQLPAEKLNALGSRHSRIGGAYDLYLRGRFLWHRLSAETNRNALEHFRGSVALDPEYGLAWAGLGVAFAASPITADVPAMRVWPAARDAAAHALRTAPNLAESHTCHGFTQLWLEWDLIAAENAFRRALTLDPSDALAHRTLGVVLAYLDRRDDARASAERACQLDPLNAAHYALFSQILLFGRDYESSLRLARQAIALDKHFWIGYLQLAQAAERLGESELALQALRDASVFSAENSKVAALQGYILARTGHHEEAERILRHLETGSVSSFVPPYAKALIHMGLNRPAEAILCLERAVEVHDVHLNFLLVDPKWDLMRVNPSFQVLLESCGFARGPSSDSRSNSIPDAP